MVKFILVTAAAAVGGWLVFQAYNDCYKGGRGKKRVQPAVVELTEEGKKLVREQVKTIAQLAWTAEFGSLASDLPGMRKALRHAIQEGDISLSVQMQLERCFGFGGPDEGDTLQPTLLLHTTLGNPRDTHLAIISESMIRTCSKSNLPLIQMFELVGEVTSSLANCHESQTPPTASPNDTLLPGMCRRFSQGGKALLLAFFPASVVTTVATTQRTDSQTPLLYCIEVPPGSASTAPDTFPVFGSMSLEGLVPPTVRRGEPST